jgi:hypothetical protein
LANVIEGSRTVDEQLDAIYEKLSSWLVVLFKDGKLERALKASGLDSGM